MKKATYASDSLVFRDEKELKTHSLDFVGEISLETQSLKAVEAACSKASSHLDDLIEIVVDNSLETIQIASTLIAEAEETMEFLMSRKASPESISGMAILIYHGKKILALAEETGSAPFSIMGEQLSENIHGY